MIYVFSINGARQVLKGRNPAVGFYLPPLGSEFTHCVAGLPYQGPGGPYRGGDVHKKKTECQQNPTKTPPPSHPF